MKLAFIIIGVVLALILLFFLFWPIIKRALEKKNYRVISSKVLYKLAKDTDSFLINNVSLAYGEFKIEFDHLYFGQKYIYCIKDTCHSYGIQGSAEDLKWFDYNSKGKFEYTKNPLKSNNIQVELLKKYMRVPVDQQLFLSLVCVNDSCDILIDKLNDFEAVINSNKMRKFILSKEQDPLVSKINQEQLETTVKLLYERCQEEK